MFIFAAFAAASTSVSIGRFERSGAPPPPWRILRLNQAVNPTRYRVAVIDGFPAVEAVADSSMALLARPVSVDLKATPVLCWQWWIDAPVATADMTRKSGDDYAARVYVAFDMPDSALSLGTRLKLMLARRLFGSAVSDAEVAIASDTDNTKSRARAAFADLRFVSRSTRWET